MIDIFVTTQITIETTVKKNSSNQPEISTIHLNGKQKTQEMTKLSIDFKRGL